MSSRELLIAEAIDDAYTLAVLGNGSGATKIIDLLRQSGDASKADEHNLGMILVEGVIANSNGNLSRARNRFSVVAELGKLVSSSTWPRVALGWLALLAYNEGKLIESAEALGRAMQGSRSIDAKATLRISTVAGLLCEYVGLSDSASEWLGAARDAIRSTNTAGLLSGVLYDHAIAAIDSAQFHRLEGRLSKSVATSLLLRVRSAMNYDIHANIGSQYSLHLLSIGMAQSLAESYGEASRTLRQFLVQVSGIPDWDISCANVELAFCMLHERSEPLQEDLFQVVQNSLHALRDPVELATAYYALMEHERRSRQDDRAEYFRAHLNSELLRRHSIESALTDALRRLSIDRPAQLL